VNECLVAHKTQVGDHRRIEKNAIEKAGYDLVGDNCVRLADTFERDAFWA
jgi:hypothetical protein